MILQTAGNATAGNATAPEPPATMVVQRERRKVIRVPLKIGGPGFALPGLSNAQRKVQAAGDSRDAPLSSLCHKHQLRQIVP